MRRCSKELRRVVGAIARSRNVLEAIVNAFQMECTAAKIANAKTASMSPAGTSETQVGFPSRNIG